MGGAEAALHSSQEQPGVGWQRRAPCPPLPFPVCAGQCGPQHQWQPVLHHHRAHPLVRGGASRGSWQGTPIRRSEACMHAKLTLLTAWQTIGVRGGGACRLDGRHVVFGEVMEGYDVSRLYW